MRLSGPQPPLPRNERKKARGSPITRLRWKSVPSSDFSSVRQLTSDRADGARDSIGQRERPRKELPLSSMRVLWEDAGPFQAMSPRELKRVLRVSVGAASILILVVVSFRLSDVRGTEFDGACDENRASRATSLALHDYCYHRSTLNDRGMRDIVEAKSTGATWRDATALTQNLPDQQGKYRTQETNGLHSWMTDQSPTVETGRSSRTIDVEAAKKTREGRKARVCVCRTERVT